ncbi:mycofactocin system glycosyltransferase [Nocardia sp. 852002-20019_SCH5090214]|jgi:mycofactocin system glycosyltransferase|uniref:Mycofactocin system glycosyltransferase n=1 Tax=Nocardia nova TaxID=37330 RepID=A0A2S5ZXP7_9NOCA|nr:MULTISPECIES: mycofactocin biosynthesis glycosyltransferase MftF [Nocardia]MBV7706580.1 mycofactocin biosynthesis glycosyltransferase MftF [Nocardia nova]OBA44520.1 mycofactocin system glycosyltransferase [Nocardia sp. 852002-20019_SCH5090214]PPI90791.1 mycofactocin system glycosyltransferase [Nocardia nova]PPJ10612.1 mycofactocin system glycosyltransferase [Nocardia nova]PPJ22558.1 mycofactocin system glycosyltransferase [Nocardia nova]
MRHDRLPNGFGVRIDPRVRTYSGGRLLVGGSPTRLLKLAPEAAALIGDGYLEVTDPQSAVVARRLLDSGVANPRPRLLPSPEEVTVVVPHCNDAAGLQRLLSALRGHSVVVVDDGSDRPVRIPRTGGRCRVTVLRHDARQGVVAARNAGLRAATTEFVAFLDSDVVPRAGWLEVMLGHFSDPEVALVAPRIVAREPDASVLGRYESARSSLDFGRRETAVSSRGSVSYAPGAALLVRRHALLAEGGFDEQMRSAADIDLCWRLERAGWRLRYEPAAHVACDQPASFGKWFGRKVSHGAAAAPLARRHAGMVAPLSVPFWTVAATALLATASRAGILGGLATLLAALIRLRRVFAELDNPTRVAAIHLARGFSAGVWRIVSALCRHYWPVTVLAMIASRRIRRLAVALAIADGLADWFTHRDAGGLDPVRYLMCKRLDDLAYGTGLWSGALRARNVAALRPAVPRH